MKSCVWSLVAVTLLSACSASPEKKQNADDTYQRNSVDTPVFSTLASGGVTLPKQDDTYQLPQINVKKGEKTDIRPPSVPIAIINNSLTQFDGERALIVYADNQSELYNLNQVQRLLKDEGIESNINGAVLTTGWSNTGRADDRSDTQIRYQIEQIKAKDASALTVSVLQMRHDGMIFTPNLADKQRYSSDRLNRLVSALTAAYNKQMQDLNNATEGTFSSFLGKDENGRVALLMQASFNQAWTKLGTVLPELGFNIKNETPGRGQRELKYSALNKEEWLRLASTQPELENGTYLMQLNAIGKNSSMVITNEENQPIPNEQATIIYQALNHLLAK